MSASEQERLVFCVSQIQYIGVVPKENTYQYMVPLVNSSGFASVQNARCMARNAVWAES